MADYTLFLQLSAGATGHWLDQIPALLNGISGCGVELDCGALALDSKQVQILLQEFRKRNLDLVALQSHDPVTIISATAHGIPARLTRWEAVINRKLTHKANLEVPLLFHQGTLRAGDQLSARGDVLVFGDVNPGASVQAGGDVMIWGRLRGIAHAGQYGNESARIVALQLCPLQLRIASSVACGPRGLPQPGLVEEAILKKGLIQIEVARIPILSSI